MRARPALLMACLLGVAACKPAQANLDEPPPNPQVALVPETLPPPTPEELATRREIVGELLAVHQRLRGDAGLAVDPPGGTVVRIAGDGGMGHLAHSLVAIRSGSGWRLELVTRPSICATHDCPSDPPRFVDVPPKYGQRIDALLADDAFYAQPNYVTYRDVLDGESVYVEVRTPERRWAGVQFPLAGGKAGELSDLLDWLVERR